MASSATPLSPSLSTLVLVGFKLVITPTFRVFLSCLNNSVRHPWSELTDCSTFSCREFFSEATSRIHKNLEVPRQARARKCHQAIVLPQRSNLICCLDSHPRTCLIPKYDSFCFPPRWPSKVQHILLLPGVLLRSHLPHPQELGLFRVNYATVNVVVLVVSLVTNPFSLLSGLVIFLTSVGSIIVSALVTGADIVTVHRAFCI
ncbi:hypothetical protein ZIOFF_002188 [Zingiber officinale]|uniref:Uncharacterized protein n=1 Tax=Zingiber officinale TaxID=94328 RepID=A0A8J5M9A4_ZINOF|nr:hypothetical protein ZIOFF_002188 [Zingiber officinale]